MLHGMTYASLFSTEAVGYILNVTEYVNENYLWVKAKFLRAIDYVEDINVGEPTPTGSSSREK